MSEKNLTTKETEGNLVHREVTRNPEHFAAPLVDIYENESGLTVLADMPGVTKDSLNIKVDQGVLTIEGRMAWQEGKTCLAQEFEPQNFFRQFELSDAFDISQIHAELKHGVLNVFLPKSEKAKPRQIPITVS